MSQSEKLHLKYRALSSKVEEMKVKEDDLAAQRVTIVNPPFVPKDVKEDLTIGALWTIAKKNRLADCVKKVMQTIEPVKKQCDRKYEEMCKIGKCYSTLRKIME